MGQALRKTESLNQSPDALTLLRTDHQHMAELFDQYQRARLRHRKQQLLTEICRELKIHAQIEEEIFYPALKQTLKTKTDKALLDEAQIEHNSFKTLMAEIDNAQPDKDELFDARVKVLAEYVEHHVKEEHRDIFPKARSAGLELQRLGELMSQRKAELLASS